MAYDKQAVVDTADSLYGLVKALGDGIDVGDSVQLIDFVTKLASSASSFKDDTDAAVVHLLARIAEKVGDDRVDVVP